MNKPEGCSCESYPHTCHAQPTREQIAVRNVSAFAVFAFDKLAPHVVEDLRIVCKLAAKAIETRSAETTQIGSARQGESAVPNGDLPNRGTSHDTK